jgi:hypothetical protein
MRSDDNDEILILVKFILYSLNNCMILVGSIETLMKYSICWYFEFISIIILFLFFKVFVVHCQSRVPVILEPAVYIFFMKHGLLKRFLKQF